MPRLQAPPRAKPRQFSELPAPLKAEAMAIAVLLARTFHERRAQASAEALLILSNEKALASSLQHYPAPIQEAVAAARGRLDAAGIDWRGATIEGRYLGVAAIQRAVTTETAPPGENFQRPARPHSDAQGLGHTDLPGHHDVDVPEHFYLRAHPDGCLAEPG